MKRTLLPLLVGGAFCISNINAFAMDLSVNGFFSGSAGVSNINKVLFTDALFNASSTLVPTYDGIGNSIDFVDNTNFAIQFTLDVNDVLSAVTQITADGQNDDFDAKAAWAYLKWAPNENWDVKLGRVRTDYFLISETIDVGYTYPWVAPPFEVYGQVPFSNHNGGSVSYKYFLGDWEGSFTGFFGNSSDTFSVKDFWGGSMRLGNEIIKFRAGYSRALLNADMTDVPAGFSAYYNLVNNPCGFFAANGLSVTTSVVGTTLQCTVDSLSVLSPTFSRNAYLAKKLKLEDKTGEFMGFGLQLDYEGLGMMAEWTQRKSNSPLITNTQGWYVMASYRIGNFQPHITYAERKTTDDDSRRLRDSRIISISSSGLNPFTGRNIGSDFDSSLAAAFNEDQHTWTVGVRWDVWPATALKFDYTYAMPQDGGKGVFTVNPFGDVSIYRAAIDVVF